MKLYSTLLFKGANCRADCFASAYGAMRSALCALVLVCASASFAQSSDYRASRLSLSLNIAENAVLQDGPEILVSGMAPPGLEVDVDLSGSKARVRATAEGKWRATLIRPFAVGPFAVTARLRNGAVAVANGIQLGEVWLCGGQSNMEMTVNDNSGISALPPISVLSRIRELRVVPTASSLPTNDLPTNSHWLRAETDAGRFSAACFYFAVKRSEVINRAIGIVNFAVGASAIQAWSTRQALERLNVFSNDLLWLSKYQSSPSAAAAEWGRILRSQWAKNGLFKAIFEGESSFWLREPQVSASTYPSYRLATGQVVWYRAFIKISDKERASASRLMLGRASGALSVWINKECAAFEVFPSSVDATVDLPPQMFSIGTNEILVASSALSSSGGMTGTARDFSLVMENGSRHDLSSLFEYQVFDGLAHRNILPPWNYLYGLTVLANSMVAPLAEISAAGFIWYQGEGNTRDERSVYQPLLADLVANISSGRTSGFKVVLVQLPRFAAVPPTPQKEGWAVVREAQRVVAFRTMHAALVVTADLPYGADLHPKNKQVIGYRIADAVTALDRNPASSGGAVEVQVAEQLGGTIKVRVASREGFVQLDQNSDVGGVEICTAAMSNCRRALASTRSDGLLHVAGLTPADEMIRYCWGDAAAACPLLVRGLPVSPFLLQIRH